MAIIFKTNVAKLEHGRILVHHLQQHFPDSRINFDLQDCDRILRVEGNESDPGKIIELLQCNGFYCEELE